jgi:hypothetical protein
MEPETDREISSPMTSGSESKMLEIQIPTALSYEESQFPSPETRDQRDDTLRQDLVQSHEDQTEHATSEHEEPASPVPENARRRRSSMVNYKEPNVRSKLRAGDQFTFSSGYDVGIKILSMAERDRDRAKRRSRESLS